MASTMLSVIYGQLSLTSHSSSCFKLPLLQSESSEHDEAAKAMHTRSAGMSGICAGKDTTNQSMFIDFAMMLWAFDFEKAVGEDRLPITHLSTDCIDQSILSQPVPFKCPFKPRPPEITPVIHTAAAFTINRMVFEVQEISRRKEKASASFALHKAYHERLRTVWCTDGANWQYDLRHSSRRHLLQAAYDIYGDQYLSPPFNLRRSFSRRGLAKFVLQQLPFRADDRHFPEMQALRGRHSHASTTRTGCGSDEIDEVRNALYVKPSVKSDARALPRSPAMWLDFIARRVLWSTRSHTCELYMAQLLCWTQH
ncbi:hypothetical protein NM688_g1902 [Phlebia brevispora]|uniref:Uncharacterized protein n=1 Tax=Phlebia brevispora TaxID=194682 RepID=A0ACC1TAS6_9APHY|nr:hypothetical protein NM688_g1902 [Phlebia brevispora]